MLVEVLKWLKHYSIKINSEYLQYRLESHPDYPSLISIQDTLEEFEITTLACNGSKEELKSENRPFLAHLYIGGGGYIVFCRSVEDVEMRVKDFDKVWSGNAIFIENPNNYNNTENAAALKSENRRNIFSNLSIFIIVASIVSIPILFENFVLLCCVISCLIGLYLSWLIIQKEFGISNSISDRICSMAKYSRCESILQAKGAKIFDWLTWGDIGIVYFSASLVFLTITMLANIPVNIFFNISILSLVYPVYSLYYQWRVVKQWCMLCIGVVSTLGINAIVSILQSDYEFINFSKLWESTIVYFIMLIGILSVWQLVKHAYWKSLESTQLRIVATRLKRNSQIFNALTSKMEFIPENFPTPDEPIRFGNPKGDYQLLVACSPFCTPCSKAHKVIEELYNKYPDKIGISIRFAIGTADMQDVRAVAVTEILKAAFHSPYEAVRDWYNDMSLEKFEQLYKSDPLDVSHIITQHIQWARNANITATPTIFLNGRKLPEIYNWMELAVAIEYELKSY